MVTAKDVYEIGEVPPIGEIPKYMYGQLIRPERFGDPQDAFQVEKVETPVDLKPLQALAEEKVLKRYLCVSLEPRRRAIGNVTVLPYQMFLRGLWEGEYS